MTDKQRAAFIYARQCWEDMEKARDELERAKNPVRSPSFVAHSSSMPKGLDDRMVRIETLRAAFERAFSRWYNAAFDFEDALDADMSLTHIRLYQAYFRDGKSLEEAADIAGMKLPTVCALMRKNGFFGKFSAEKSKMQE